MLSRTARLVLVLALILTGSPAQTHAIHDVPVVVPLHKLAAGQWVETVSGDPAEPGEVFAIRIHNDAGYIVSFRQSCMKPMWARSVLWSVIRPKG